MFITCPYLKSGYPVFCVVLDSCLENAIKGEGQKMLRTIKQIVLTAVVLVVVAGCGDSESQRDEETGLGPREIANKVIACYAA